METTTSCAPNHRLQAGEPAVPSVGARASKARDVNDGSKSAVNEVLAARLMAIALLVTAGSFSWAAWDLFHWPTVQFTKSIVAGLVLLALCLVSWTSGTLVMLRWRRSYLDRSQAREMTGQLERERDLLRMIIDNMPDYLYAKDLEGRFVLNNMAHARAMGVEAPQELVGKSDFDFFPEELAAKYRADEERILCSGEALLNHEQIRADRDGRTRWVSASKVIWRDPKGNIIGIAGISRDIHESKLAKDALHKSEKLFRTLVDTLPQQVFFKDRQLAFASVNSAFAKAHGKFAEDLIGKSDFDLFPKDVADRCQSDDRRVMNSGKIQVTEEASGSNGQSRVLEAVKLPVMDQGEVIGLLGVSTDITERKMAEARLREFASQLERSNRELQDFAYVASHDLQEPLRKIVVFGDRLREKAGETLGPDPCDYLDRMQKAASRMQNLINDLLTFSRVTTKAKPFEKVDLDELAREVVDDLGGRIEQVKGRVEVGQLPPIAAEALQMRQLIQNLIANALKFRRPEVAPVVKVDARIIIAAPPRAPAGAAPERLCELTVSDNGIGFDEKYLDRIFNVFQRLHSRNEYEGTGMGLAIAKKIVLYHRGEITAKSRPGHGAAFIVTLPVVHPKEDSK